MNTTRDFLSFINSSEPCTTTTGLKHNDDEINNDHHSHNNSPPKQSQAANNSNLPWKPFSIDNFSAPSSNFASEVTNQPSVQSSTYLNTSCINSDVSTTSSSSNNHSITSATTCSPFYDFLLINTGIMFASPTIPLLVSPFDLDDQPLVSMF